MTSAPKKPEGVAEVVPLRPPRKCPICGKPAVRAYYPFDSKRCADADLGRWLTGRYVIPGSEATPGLADEDDSEGGEQA